MFNFWIQESFSLFGLSITFYALFILLGVIIAVWAGIKV